MNLKLAWVSVFGKLKPATIAAWELSEAELKLLEAQTAQEYAASIISYNERRIKRLREYLANLPKTDGKQ